jgi:hypothetical protein
METLAFFTLAAVAVIALIAIFKGKFNGKQ